MGEINAGDTAWVLTASALVLLMTPGLAFFYGGMVRHDNILNTMMMSIISMGVVGVLWTLIGFSLAFGGSDQLIGDFRYLGLEGLDDKPWKETTIPSLVFAIFQMTFAIIAAAIISGAIVERMRFGAYVILIALWCLLVYCPLAHWVWGGGWIEEMGALDFAGGTVVHISSAVAAAVAALVLGKRSEVEVERTPHNMPFVALGGFLLWFGWAGFNGGSALAADFVAARAVATTFIAASSGMVARVAVERFVDKRASMLGAINGFVAGLVTITPAAGFVKPVDALLIGALGALACTAATRLLEKWDRLDDSLDCFGIHGVGGIVGAILTGVFAIDGGLLYGGGWRLVCVQTIGALAGAVFSGVVTFLIMITMRLVMDIRASEEHEELGLDFSIHKEAAYEASTGMRQVNSMLKDLEHSARVSRSFTDLPQLGEEAGAKCTKNQQRSSTLSTTDSTCPPTVVSDDQPAFVGQREAELAADSTRPPTIPKAAQVSVAGSPLEEV